MTAPNQTGAIAKRAKSDPSNTKDKPLKAYLKVYASEIARALPSAIGADRFNRICMSTLTSRADLASCTPESFIGCILNVAQLGLEPNTPLGEAYLIPYNGKCTMQLGYKGLLTLARRSGEIALVKAVTVYQNDDFSYTLGLNPDLHHVPAAGPRGEPVAWYAFYKTKDGFSDFEVMYKSDVEALRNLMPNMRKSDAWRNHYDSMAKKTVLKRVLKYAPMSTEVARQVAQDGVSVDFDKDSPELMKDLTLAPSTTVIEGEFEEYEDGQALLEQQLAEYKTETQEA